MPVWAQIIIGTAAVILAAGTIWTKLLRPAAKLITTTEKMLPLLQQLTETFGNTPDAFKVLHEIAAQFRTDSGSSLRDVVNRLDKAAEENRAAGELLKVGVEATRQLAEIDRATMLRAIVFLDRLGVKVDAGTATGKRIEQHAEDVAADLAASHRRADEVVSLSPGAAADAAAQQTAKEMREGGG